ncbi:hypothetical protein KUTeg_009701 [Tegillarca granosa]|uniref:Uncharacterized protein n=1 Tax=Tegillarca granosa TaxID=220873 RepID=A0ABQ9F9Q3_TEGGR|nr:hypothetical protein KUTeg_009701 [Tegillarca granosa]
MQIFSYRTMKYLIVIVAFVTFGLVYGLNHHDHDHGGEKHGVCQQPSGNVICNTNGDCQLSLCLGECSPACDNGKCKCEEQHSNMACSTAANCTTACHPDQAPYCHSGMCHCHEEVECQSSAECTCRNKFQIPVCDPDPDNIGHKHCHCI